MLHSAVSLLHQLYMHTCMLLHVHFFFLCMMLYKQNGDPLVKTWLHNTTRGQKNTTEHL